MTKTLQLAGTPELLAATDGKPTRLKILGYTGEPVIIAGWGQVLIDLAGVQVGASIPLLDAHKNALASTLGQGSARVDAGRLLVEGALAATEAGKQVEALLRSGVQLQASVGLEPTRHRWLKEGEQVTANGRTWTMTQHTVLVEAGILREVSILPLGADPNTQVNIAAGLSNGGTNMPDNVVDPVVTERERVDSIYSTFGSLNLTGQAAEQASKIRAQAIAEGWTVEAAKAACLDLLRASRPVASTITPTGGSGGGLIERRHIEASLLVRAGFERLAEKEYGPQVLEQSRRLHGSSLVDLSAACLQAAGQHVPIGREAMIKAAFSSGDMATALGNTANKILWAQYMEAPSPWRSFALVRQANDFKTQTGIRPTFAFDLEQVAEHGEIKHGSFGEETYTWQVDTYGKMLAVGRKSIVNDDLGAFSEALPAMARAAARKLNDLVANAVLGNAGSFWSAGNSPVNYFSGASTNLQASSLTTAMQMIRTMKDSNGYLLDLMPRMLYVPPELEVTARELLNSAEVFRYVSSTVDRQPSGNAMQNVCGLVIDPRLSDSSYTGYSTTAWWLFSDPGSVVVAFLQGMAAPKVEMTEADFDTLGVQMRVYHDFGVALADGRLSVKSKGAA